MRNFYSPRTGTEHQLETYEKDGQEVISHTALKRDFWSLPDDQRPDMEVEPVDLRNLPGIPPMFAVKCTLKKGGVRVEELGEILCMDWENMPEISRKFPLTMAENMAFDRAYIRYMQFTAGKGDGSCPVPYSSTEMDIPDNASEAMLTSKTLPDAAQNGATGAAYPNGMECGMTGDGLPDMNAAMNPPKGPAEPEAEYRSVVNALNVQPYGPGKALVVTDKGDFLFEASTGQFRFRNLTVKVNEEVCSDVYDQASAMLGRDLMDYAQAC